MNLQLFESIEAIVREAGQIVKNAHAGSEQIEKKEGLANFVTEYDVKVQEYLIGEFQKLIPDAAYFGEEATDGNMQQASAEGYTFYIDPIDGTTNFMF
ncbi:MAG: inositol monophosphatase, partial [Firmicutes bacterium]|nr:inositol monophosphatase [Bacillota bacterium]